LILILFTRLGPRNSAVKALNIFVPSTDPQQDLTNSFQKKLNNLKNSHKARVTVQGPRKEKNENNTTEGYRI
jgi:hypothetical protein